ncbi:MAG: cytotoxic translational repressor of toxin-antitoxin stability system [Methanobacterium sp. Maddingley MBC34]|nr:MAG: cytotoxic translational repressor of toxin-antitoxin stability system [Methanobacterium sp. Maddingley MBC34]
MYKIAFDPSFQAILNRLKERDPKAYNNVIKKIRQVAINLEMNPSCCKNLKAPLQKYKRVHVNKSFVIVFQVDVRNSLMIVYDYDHHKRIYKKIL